MFHSPYCFLSKLTIQNPICKKVPIFSLSLLFSFKTNYSEPHLQKSSHFFTLLVVFFQKNYSEPHSQNRLYEASFSLQYLSKFHADQYYPAAHINKTGVGNSSVHPDFLPPHRFFTYF